MRTLNSTEVEHISGSGAGSALGCAGGVIALVGTEGGWALAGGGVATAGACYETYDDLTPEQKALVNQYAASSPTSDVAGSGSIGAAASAGASAGSAFYGMLFEVVRAWKSLGQTVPQ